MYRRCLEKAKLLVAFTALFISFVSIPLSYFEVANSIFVFVGLISMGFIIGFATNELFYEYWPEKSEDLQERAWRNQSKNPAFRDYDVTDEDEEDLQKLKVNRPYMPKRIKQYLLMAATKEHEIGRYEWYQDTFDSRKEAEGKIRVFKEPNSVEYEIDNRRYEWYQIVDLKDL